MADDPGLLRLASCQDSWLDWRRDETQMKRFADLMIWPGLVPMGLVRFNGAAELAGALGLVLPGLLHVKSWLTCYAAYGLTMIMVMAMGFHLSHSGWYLVFPNLLLGGMALFVGIGRTEDHTPLPER